MRNVVLSLALIATLALTGCDDLVKRVVRPTSANEFPSANRPVAPTVSARWSDEESRDRLNEADTIMDRAGIAQGMTVADIGAGDGYYTVRLSQRVGAAGRVLAQDVDAKTKERLGVRIARDRLDNVSVALGGADDPRLPANSFDRVFMVHMYHEIQEPYAFLWRLWPSLRGEGQIIVVDSNRPTIQHGTPLPQLICEFQAAGFRPLEFVDMPNAGGYFARFVRAPTRPRPEDIRVCSGAG